MLQVELDHILPESDAYSRIREIIENVEQEKEVYVVTKEGRPVVAIVNVDLLDSVQDIAATPQTAPLDSLFGLATAPAAEATPTFTEVPPTVLPPLPEPIAEATPATVAAPAFAPPVTPEYIPAPMAEAQTYTPAPMAAAPTYPTAPSPEPTPIGMPASVFPSEIPASSGSILDEPLPPLNGTEHLQSPLPIPPPVQTPQ